DANALVELPLGAAELHRADQLCFRGEFWSDRLFEATQYEGADATAELVDAVGIAIVFDRDLKAALEVAPGPEQAGQNEVEQGPKLGEVVLDRRAAQKEAVARGELSGRHAREAQGVLDGLGF